MKIRNDFVTNSSSSSFIIAYRNINIDKDTVDKYPYIAKLYENMINAIIEIVSCEDTNKADVYKSVDEYTNVFLRENGWLGNTLEEIFEAEPFLKEQYAKITSALSDGYCIMVKNVDNNDEGLSSILSMIAKDNNDFVILYQDE